MSFVTFSCTPPSSMYLLPQIVQLLYSDHLIRERVKTTCDALSSSCSLVAVRGERVECFLKVGEGEASRQQCMFLPHREQTGQM